MDTKQTLTGRENAQFELRLDGVPHRIETLEQTEARCRAKAEQRTREPELFGMAPNRSPSLAAQVSLVLPRDTAKAARQLDIVTEAAEQLEGLRDRLPEQAIELAEQRIKAGLAHLREMSAREDERVGLRQGLLGLTKAQRKRARRGR